MKNKKVTLLIVVITLLVLVFLVLLFLPKKKQSVQDKPTATSEQETKIKSFAENFIRDFTTYDYKNTSEYMERINQYIAPQYFSDFKSRFLLPKKEEIKQEEKENFSKYLSSEVIVLSEKDDKITVYIQYTVMKKDAPGRPQEFKNEGAVTAIIKKLDDAFKITRLDFSDTD